MAITKLTYLKEAKGFNPHLSLKKAIEYIKNPEKTRNGELVGSLNCNKKYVYEEMIMHKEAVGKIDKRQGYHFILSFDPNDDVNPDKVFDITQQFCQSYFKDKYQVVFGVHDDHAHLHGHIVFNSVSLYGNKYRYQKGDWEKTIQPIVNDLCKEYGLSTIEVDCAKRYEKKSKNQNYGEWKAEREGKSTWLSVIRQDLDTYINQAESWEGFLDLLQENHYEYKLGKHFVVRPEEKERFVRERSLGEEYTVDNIKARILSGHQYEQSNENVRMVKRNRSPKLKAGKKYKIKKKEYLTPFRRTFVMRLYWASTFKRGGQVKKNYFRYRQDIFRLEQLQKQINYIYSNGLNTIQDVDSKINEINDKKRKLYVLKKQLIKKREVYQEESREWKLLSDEISDYDGQIKQLLDEYRTCRRIKEDTLRKDDIIR